MTDFSICMAHGQEPFGSDAAIGDGQAKTMFKHGNTEVVYVVPTLTLTLSPTVLSDLFFNYEHPAYDAIMKLDLEDSPDAQYEINEAILKDAEEFAGTLLACQGYTAEFHGSLAIALATDFFKRL